MLKYSLYLLSCTADFLERHVSLVDSARVGHFLAQVEGMPLSSNFAAVTVELTRFVCLLRTKGADSNCLQEVQ